MLQQVVMGPLSRTLGLIIIFAVFTLSTGSVNGWYLLAEPACVVSEERFDRVVAKSAAPNGDTADKAWQLVTNGAEDSAATIPATLATDHTYILSNANPGCRLSSANAGATGIAQQVFTPLGTEITVGAYTTSGPPMITGGEWAEAGSIFNAGGLSGLIKLILQAAGLGLPIGALIGLASFGNAFVTRMGGSPLMGAIIMVIALLLVGTLLNVLTPFVNTVKYSLDNDRYVMYDEGIGTLATVISNFFAVVLVGGLIYVAWQVISQFRETGNDGSMFGDTGRTDRM